MNIKNILPIMFLCLCASGAQAEEIQHIHLKGGTQLNGYVSFQDANTNDRIVKTETASFILPEKDVKSISGPVAVKISDLEPAAVDWAVKNEAFKGKGDDRTIQLYNIVTSSHTISKAYLMERGARVRFVELCSSEYRLSGDSIRSITTDLRAKEMLSGLNSTYELVNGRYTGQLVEDIPGKTISINDENGMTVSFNRGDIKRTYLTKVNPTQDIFEQVWLLDVVELEKNAGRYTGIITERNYESKNYRERYLTLLEENGSQRSIKLLDVKSYNKIVNPRYQPKTDVLLSEGEVNINRVQAKPIAVTENSSFGLVLSKSDDVTCNVKRVGNIAEIAVEYRHDEYAQNPFSIILLKTNVKQVKQNGVKKNVLTYYFDYKDIVNSNIIPVQSEVSVNETERVVYRMQAPGQYALYNKNTKVAYLFSVQ